MRKETPQPTTSNLGPKYIAAVTTLEVRSMHAKPEQQHMQAGTLPMQTSM
jgi:hypothetical protein